MGIVTGFPEVIGELGTALWLTVRGTAGRSIGRLVDGDNSASGPRVPGALAAIIRWRGEVAERSNAAVLKTVEPKGSGGSNPSLSAKSLS